jgi:two-component system phosphate regulon response regulator PhoB
MAPNATSPAPSPVSGRLRVLIVEDERDLVELLTYNLQREGYDTIVAHDGQEGLRKAQTHLPDLILLDIMLPGMNGTEICRAIRAGERTRDIPIIILSAKIRRDRPDRRLLAGS